MILTLVLLVSACAPATLPPQRLEPLGDLDIRSTPHQGEGESRGEEPRINVRIDDPKSYRFPQLIPPDGIRPVYEPEFESGVEVDLQADELVLGVAIDGQAKAYPISVLRNREMVNDELAGIPLLVTW